MPLNPVKSMHEGNWLHFNSLSGGMWLRQLSIHFWKPMISVVKRSYFLQHPVEVDSVIL